MDYATSRLVPLKLPMFPFPCFFLLLPVRISPKGLEKSTVWKELRSQNYLVEEVDQILRTSALTYFVSMK